MTHELTNRADPLRKPIAIYYEHPDWFRPLFAQLDARGADWTTIDARNHTYNPSAADAPYSLVFNRMSPSAWKRGLADGIFYTLGYLAHLEAKGVRVINGLRGFTHEISKALQLNLLERLGLDYPQAVVIHRPSQAALAAKEIGFPLVVKPNIGGSGAGIVCFSNSNELDRAVAENNLFFGIDSTALVQEYFPARDSIITRVEVLGGKYLYAIQIHITGETFDLCPADICKSAQGEELVRSACAVDAPKTGSARGSVRRTSASQKRRRANHADRGNRYRRRRIRDRRSRRPPALLRHQRAIKFRRRAGTRDWFQPLRENRRLPNRAKRTTTNRSPLRN